jgi:hypothetical protein
LPGYFSRFAFPQVSPGRGGKRVLTFPRLVADAGSA